MANSADPDHKTLLLTNLKEIITAVMALTILGVTAYMLLRTFCLAGQISNAGDANATKSLQDAFGRQKDILLYGFSALGAVIGYYFGRVPAELHAQAAQKQATQAQAQLDHTQDKLANAAITAAQAIESKKAQADDFKRTLFVLRSNLSQPSAAPRQALRAQPQTSGLDQALAEIDELIKRLDL